MPPGGHALHRSWPGMDMSRWLRILVTCLSLASFLIRNTSALGDCHHDHEGEVAILASQSPDDPDRDGFEDPPAPSPDGPCQIPGGCVHCTIGKMPCAASDATLTMTTLWLGNVLPETSLTYTPPSSGRLIRPPR